MLHHRHHIAIGFHIEISYHLSQSIMSSPFVTVFSGPAAGEHFLEIYGTPVDHLAQDAGDGRRRQTARPGTRWKLFIQ